MPLQERVVIETFIAMKDSCLNVEPGKNFKYSRERMNNSMNQATQPAKDGPGTILFQFNTLAGVRVRENSKKM